MSGSGLSGKLYPVHLKPKDDELLTSWIVRLALAHGLTRTLSPTRRLKILFTLASKSVELR